MKIINLKVKLNDDAVTVLTKKAHLHKKTLEKLILDQLNITLQELTGKIKIQNPVPFPSLSVKERREWAESAKKAKALGEDKMFWPDESNNFTLDNWEWKE